MPTKLRIMSLSEFRANATQTTDWVRREGGRVWITKHGKSVCALVPLEQCEEIEKMEGRPRSEDRTRLETLYRHWKSAKNQGLTPDEDREWREMFKAIGEGRRGF